MVVSVLPISTWTNRVGTWVGTYYAPEHPDQVWNAAEPIAMNKSNDLRPSKQRMEPNDDQL